MNDFVLRGFCRRCGMPVSFIMESERVVPMFSHDFMRGEKRCAGATPQWVLSAKQMGIISITKFADFPELKKYEYGILISFEMLLQKNPLLVARILKEAGRKKNEKEKE